MLLYFLSDWPVVNSLKNKNPLIWVIILNDGFELPKESMLYVAKALPLGNYHW